MSDSTIGKYPALRSADFRLLWLGQLISSSGTQMQFVAINWQIYVLTDSPIALGLIGLARFVPIVLFALVGGVIADRYNRKKVLLVSQTLLMILAGVLTITTITNTITPWIIYLVTAILSSIVPFDSAARQAFVPNLVDRKYFANAMSLNVIMMQTSKVAGPVLAGFLIGYFGVGSVYLINAFSFVAMLCAVLMIKTSGEVQGKVAEMSLAAVKEGLVFVKGHTIIWSTMVLDFFSTLFSSATALLPIFAKDILAVGPQGLGILYAAPSIGAVAMGFLLAHMGTLRKEGRLLLLAIASYGLGTILFGLSHNFFLSIVALIIVGAGDSISTIIRNVVRQLNTPDSIRGRITGINMIFFMGGPELGEFEAGMVAAWIGAPLSVVTGGIGTLVAVALVAILIPKLRNYDQAAHI